MKINHQTLLAVAGISVLASFNALAGGALYVTDTETPYTWDVSSPIPVYTDLGDLCDTDPAWPNFGCLTNEEADALVEFSYAEWNNVATSSFQAEVVGDFSAVGLGDITGANGALIVGADNGGGMHVMYDTDGSILTDFFGIPMGVLGIATPEWAVGDTIVEGWAVINVASVPAIDGWKILDQQMSVDAAAGVFTHEFGHSINLAHSQANGIVTFFSAPWNWVSWSPGSCSAPYDSTAITDWTAYGEWFSNEVIPNTETMYPFISPSGTGKEMSTVNGRDDIVAVSNLYPAAGWPASHGSISGHIQLSDESTGLTGVNVVARNVNDSLGDVITVMSGDLTQGMIGPDGRFTINGLTPGEEYVVYVEEIKVGGFPTPPAILPSFPEYWNGGNENGDANSDDACEWSVIPAVAGTTTSVDISFNGGDKRSPSYVRMPLGSAVDVSTNGKVVVGSAGTGLTWTWSAKDGYAAYFGDGAAKLTRNGHTLMLNAIDGEDVWTSPRVPAFVSPQNGWQPLGLPDGREACGSTVVSAWDTSWSGNTVVGLGFDGCSEFHAVKWNKGEGWNYLPMPETVQGAPVYGARANQVSGDGMIIGGHIDAWGWKGASWVNDEFHLIGEDDPKGYVGSVNSVSDDGVFMAGGGAGEWGTDAYIWSANGTLNIGNIPCADPFDFWCSIFQSAEVFGLNGNGSVAVGRYGSFFTSLHGFIWTEEIGMMDFNEFMQGQGIIEASLVDLISPLAISGDGKTIVGWGVSANAMESYAITLDQVWVCRNGKSSLTGFPGGLKAQLKSGSELGMCQADLPISPGM